MFKFHLLIQASHHNLSKCLNSCAFVQFLATCSRNLCHCPFGIPFMAVASPFLLSLWDHITSQFSFDSAYAFDIIEPHLKHFHLSLDHSLMVLILLHWLHLLSFLCSLLHLLKCLQFQILISSVLSIPPPYMGSSSPMA